MTMMMIRESDKIEKDRTLISNLDEAIVSGVKFMISVVGSSKVDTSLAVSVVVGRETAEPADEAALKTPPPDDVPGCCFGSRRL